MSARCRRAGPDDLDRILALEAGSFAEERFSRRQMRYLLLRARGAFFVAEADGVVAGYVCALTRRGGHGRIYSLCVAPDRRRQGLAGLLIDAALEFLRASGAGRVFLEVESDNAAAVALYEKKGFAARSVKPGYYRSGGDALSMWRELFGDSPSGL